MQHAEVWRAGERCHPQVGLPTGFTALDAKLPAGGWVRGTLVELLTDPPGLGAMRLLLPLFAHFSQMDQAIAFIAPPFMPYAPALQQAGINLSALLLIVEGRTLSLSTTELLWASEQVLRAPACAVVVLWLDASIGLAHLRRLQLACEAGGAYGFIVRPVRHAKYASPAQLRLGLSAKLSGQMIVRFIKCRGPRPTDCVV